MSQIDFNRRYGGILEVGNIDIDRNISEAKNMSMSEWVKAVGTKGKWDYKNNVNLIKAEFDPKLLDEFGNVHFGMVANAFGFNLEGSMYGAGLYQVTKQGGGNRVELIEATSLMNGTAGGYLLPDDYSRSITRNGFSWGDNKGDALNIMRGWDFAKDNY
ncbi:MAG: polymorphic toxin type 44 domain-containing protein [Candidatus Thiodiazotropha sp.]